MNKFVLPIALMISFVLFGTSCDKEDDNLQSSIIDGLTIDTYPNVDGSTSTAPLNMIIACKLLDVKYKWVQDFSNTQMVQPRLSKKIQIK